MVWSSVVVPLGCLRMPFALKECEVYTVVSSSTTECVPVFTNFQRQLHVRIVSLMITCLMNTWIILVVQTAICFVRGNQLARAQSASDTVNVSKQCFPCLLGIDF